MWIPGDVSGFQQMTDLDHLYVEHINELRSKFDNLTSLPFVNIIDYGAVGDGITDDYHAFVAAEAALPTTGGTIVLPPGIFAISDTINPTKRVSYIGSGFDCSRNNSDRPSTVPITNIKWIGTAGGTMFLGNHLGSIKLSGLNFDGNSSSNWGIYLISMNGSIFENVSITGTIIGGMLLIGSTTVLTDDCANNEFRNIYTFQTGIGIRLIAGSNISNACHNKFYNININAYGSSSPGLEILGCDSNYFFGVTVRPGSGYGIYVGTAETLPCTDIHFFGVDAGSAYVETAQVGVLFLGYTFVNGTPLPVIEAGAEVLIISQKDFNNYCAGGGFIATSPNGSVKKRIGIDNLGNVVATTV